MRRFRLWFCNLRMRHTRHTHALNCPGGHDVGVSCQQRLWGEK
jgi:hypothetical protein